MLGRSASWILESGGREVGATIKGGRVDARGIIGEERMDAGCEGKQSRC